MSDMPPGPRRAPCCTAASAGKEVAAAEAAPRIRINDLRDIPAWIELIRLSSFGRVEREIAIWINGCDDATTESRALKAKIGNSNLPCEASRLAQ
jgi:hypothetical protein